MHGRWHQLSSSGMCCQAASSVKTSKVKNNSTWSVKSKKWQNRLQDLVGYRGRLINLVWLLCVLSQGQRVILPQHTCSRVGLYYPPIPFPQNIPFHQPKKCFATHILPEIKNKGHLWVLYGDVLLLSCVLYWCCSSNLQQRENTRIQVIDSGTLMFSKNVISLVFNATFLKHESNLGFEEAAGPYFWLRFYLQMCVCVLSISCGRKFTINVHIRTSICSQSF